MTSPPQLIIEGMLDPSRLQHSERRVRLAPGLFPRLSLRARAEQSSAWFQSLRLLLGRLALMFIPINLQALGWHFE